MINLNEEIGNTSNKNEQSSNLSTPEAHVRRLNRKQKKINEYILGDILGYGQTGTTYEALKEGTDDEYILKLHDGRYANDKIFKKIIEDEIRLSQNPAYGFVRICDHGIIDGQYYVVRPRANREDKEDYFAHNNDEFHSEYREACLNDIKKIASSILKNLILLHRDGNVHGNIKKNNIIWNPISSQILLTDYGLNSLKKKSNVLYDPYQLYSQSREQILNPQKPTPSADIFAIGKFMYDFVQVNVQPPDIMDIVNGNFAATLRNGIAQGIDFKPIKQLLDDDYLSVVGAKNFEELGYDSERDDEFPEDYEYYYIDSEFAEVIDRAIKKEPSERYQSAEEFLDALDKVIVC